MGVLDNSEKSDFLGVLELHRRASVWTRDLETAGKRPRRSAIPGIHAGGRLVELSYPQELDNDDG